MRNIILTKEDFEIIKEAINSNSVTDDDCFMGIQDGALSAEIALRDDIKEDSIIADVSIYALNNGLDDDYAVLKSDHTTKIPFGYEAGFYLDIKDTYEDTVTEFVRRMDEVIIECHLEDFINTDITWDMIE